MEHKRQLTIGVKWNSAAAFFVMWLIYCIVVAGLSLGGGEHWSCTYLHAYLIMRFAGLLPMAVIARLWDVGWWPRGLPEPEWVGVMFLTYAALCFAFGFATSINDTCGTQVEIAENLVYITMEREDPTPDDNAWQPLEGGVTGMLLKPEGRHKEGSICEVFAGSGGVVEEECDVRVLVDRRTLFERSLFLGVSQLLFCLFAFTSLFKPAYSTVTTYTMIIWIIGFLACWYQGFEFWEDQARVHASGVGAAIFLFMSGCVINTYSAMVMHNMERDLVKASNEMNDNKHKVPTGEGVVFVHADIEGSSRLAKHHRHDMDQAMGLFKTLFTTLAKEYYGPS